MSAAAITPSLRCRGAWCCAGSGFLISIDVPERPVAPRIESPKTAGPSVPPSLMLGAESPLVLDALASFAGRDGAGAAGFAQNRHGTGLGVLWSGGSGCGGAGLSAGPPPPR